MPLVRVNGVNLYYEMTGESPVPLIFSHEFAGDYRSWEAQVRFFSRRYRVITYNGRGYAPSDVPTNPEAYSQAIAVDDLYCLLQHLKFSKAHIIGLSMGGNIALNFGIKYPEGCASLVIAGCGAGSSHREQYEKDAKTMADRLEKEGMEKVAEFYSMGPTRVQFRRKDPRGWQEFLAQLKTHSAMGSALILRGIQLKRPTIFALDADLKKIKVPTLIMIGDEDELCIDPAIFMKRHIRPSALVVFPQTGHTMNLEEPDLFNRVILDFLTLVEANKWAVRDPVSVPGARFLPK
jgi:pimeloyl-ACP methyl ester carboxylesterase